MRVFYLVLDASAFAPIGNVWTTIQPVDLYQNDSYINYSVTKSAFGSNQLGTNVWTGLTTTDDSGSLSGNRWIDTSGRIDIVNFVVPQDQISHTGTGNVGVSLDLYTAQAADDLFPSEYTAQLGILQQDEINLVDSYRYAMFVLNLTPQVGDTITGFKVYVRVEIDVPNMVPFYRRTRTMLDKFPEWMAMREIGNPNPTATDAPVSRGGKLLNAMAGEWLDDLIGALSYLDVQRFIDSVDLNQMAWVWRSTQVPGLLESVVGDGVVLAQAADLAEFKQALPDEDVFWWDEDNQDVYSNKQYNALTLNGTVFRQTPQHVWNFVDDLGLLVDLNRLTLESNSDFRLRILDVHRNPPGVGMDSFKLALRRELSLWQYYGSATPDSTFLGATPEVLEMADIEQDPTYVMPDGMPTDKFTHLVAFLADQYPTTWGHFFWNKALWNVGGDNHEGFGVLPYRMDNQPLPDEDTQSGIGDGSDLYVLRPDVIGGPHHFQAKLRMRGRQKVNFTALPPVEFDVEVYGTADKRGFSNPIIAPWVTVELTPRTGSSTYFYSFQLLCQSDVNVQGGVPSPASYSTVELFDISGITDPLISWLDTNTGIPYADTSATPVTPPNAFDHGAIQTLVLKPGRWDPSSQTYLNFEGGDDFIAWFSNDASTVIHYNTPNGFPTVNSVFSTAAPAVVMASLSTSFTVIRWQSESFVYHISLNGDGPDVGKRDVTLPFPDIPWDNNLEFPPNKQIVVSIATSNFGNYGVFSQDGTGQGVFLDYSNVSVDGDNNWAGGFPPQKVFDPDVTDAITFSSDYNAGGYTWQLFEAEQLVAIDGVVDENGPFRGGLPVNFGNNNFALTRVSPTRSDFGIAESTDIVITWMGIDVLDDQQVLVWLDNNTVKPALEDNDITYPDGVIQEFYDGAHFTYSSVVVRARLRPDPAPQWYPQVHAGYFYDRQKEYYLYADPFDFQATGATPVALPGVARQGAPIIVHVNGATPREIRQVFFWDPAATPTVPTLTNTETVHGTGTMTLFLAYSDVYNLDVFDVTAGRQIPSVPFSVDTNEVVLPEVTDHDHQYRVRYMLNGSFYADNDAIEDNKQITRLIFDKPASAWGDSAYAITYENSELKPATPASVELSPLYSTFNEGFIYISHNEYSLDQIIAAVNPSTIVADGLDYILISMRSLDVNGNPKPNQTFNLSTTWGYLDKTTVTTDKDGFAVVTLTSGASTNTLKGRVTITGNVSTSFVFDITPLATPLHIVNSVAAADAIPADGVSTNIVYGRIEDPTFVPVPQAYVRWVRGRSLYDLFTFVASQGGSVATMGSGIMGQGTMGGSGTVNAHDFGTVLSDDQGVFLVGPFSSATPSATGYWFLMMESNEASPSGTKSWPKSGDVVVWHEYPDIWFGVENISGLPQRAVQLATPVSDAIPYAKNNQFPVNYWEDPEDAPATPAFINWLPSQWYALDAYQQYQLGLYGSTPNDLDINRFPFLHPAKKDI